jgi:glycosyltransferase involved in cell wall biosynthesis
MITFVSTFPPVVCGIGDYTKYLVEKMPKDRWRVIILTPDRFPIRDNIEIDRENALCTVSPSDLSSSIFSYGDLFWFQHEFGIWEKEADRFIDLIKEAKRRRKRVVITLHTIHFESDETDEGLRKREKRLLNKILPIVDAATVFSNGAYHSVTNAFPEYKEKIVVLRHGVHLYEKIDKEKAREMVLRYIREDLGEDGISYEHLFGKKRILIGNVGFITKDKNLLDLYQLQDILRRMLFSHNVIAIYIGMIQKKKYERQDGELLQLLERLKSTSDRRMRFFFNGYIPENMFPFIYNALDFAVFWFSNATQSGRMAHAQGTDTIVVGRDLEGIGETLRLSGLPYSDTLEGLAEKIEEMLADPKAENEVKRRNKQYAVKFSFENQAKKHLLIEESILSRDRLPKLDLV